MTFRFHAKLFLRLFFADQIFRSDDPWGAFESAEVSDGKVSKEWVGF